MLDKVLKVLYNEVSKEKILNEDILKSNSELSDLINQLCDIDLNMSCKLDCEIGNSLNLHSEYYFEKGFIMALKLALEFKDENL